MPTAEILSQGDEVVTGQVTDTNAAWLAEQLTAMGFDVLRHVSVGDRLPHIRDLLRASTSRADLTICTGGLGPTDDDLTTRAAAEAFDRPLSFHPEILERIQARYDSTGRHMPPTNRKQACLPEQAICLDNDWGTAPGFALDGTPGWLVCLPGVPREMYALFEHRVVPLLHDRFELIPGRLVTLRTTGVGESTLQQRIGSFDVPGVVLSYRTRLPENHIKLRFAPEVDIQPVVTDLADRIGSPLFSIEGLNEPGGSLPEVVGRALIARGETLAVAESCTGGGIGALCTSVAGSSAWFLEGAITYSNAAKQRLVGVRTKSLDTHGAVSEPVAREMADGVRERSGATFGLSSTGIAGPSGDTPDKPVGTVHIALSCPEGTHHRHIQFSGSRHRVQTLTASAAVDLLRRHLQAHLTL